MVTLMEKQSYRDRLKKLNPSQAIAKSRTHFSEKAYGDKLRSYGGKMGTKVVYYSLLLYYAFRSPDTPKKAKMTIAGALGYLILPADVIPDIVPMVGFADDSAVIIYAVYQVWSHIDEQVKVKAKSRMKKLLGDDVDTDSLEDPPSR